MKSLTVVIPTLFPDQSLLRCLKTLFPALSFIPKEKRAIIIVNNGQKLKNNFLDKEIIILQNPKNLGFAYAVNQGIKKVPAQYYLILNDDCFLEKETVKKMIDFLERNSKFFATQPVISNINNQIENLGFYVDLKIAKAHLITNQSYWKKKLDKKRFILGLSATCLLAKKELFEKIGFFDEGFHSYLEDVDLSIRCARKNLPLFPTLSAKAFHLHMNTSKKLGSYKAKKDFVNWIKIIRKHYSGRVLVKHLPYLFLERIRNFSGIIKSFLRYPMS